MLDYEVIEVLLMTSLSFYWEKEFQISSVSEITELGNLDQNLFQKI